MRRLRTGREEDNWCGDGGQIGRWITSAEMEGR